MFGVGPFFSGRTVSDPMEYVPGKGWVRVEQEFPKSILTPSGWITTGKDSGPSVSQTFSMLGPGAKPGTSDVSINGKPLVGGGYPASSSLKPTGPQFYSDGTLAGGGYPVGSSQNPQLESAIAGLLTPGLVPDIARQSAEISAGRGIASSPAASSTGVRMSEQNWLQRLGLANTLLSGESSRSLPYQITPYQQKLLELQQKQLELQQFELQNRNQLRYGTSGVSYGRGGGGYGGYGGSVSGLRTPTTTSSPYSGMDFSSGFGAPQGGSVYGGSGGLGGGLGDAWTLDDTYEWLGFGDFGSLPGDVSGPIEPPDFDWEMWE